MRNTSHHRAVLTVGRTGGFGTLPMAEPRRTETHRNHYASSEASSEESGPLRRRMAARALAVVTALFR